MNRLTGTTAKIHVRPKIRPVSAMIDPTPLPKARPGFPMKAAITETTASGVVVPREITVAPMTIFGRPVLWAKSTTPSIIQSAPFESRTIQKAIINRSTNVGNPETRCSRRLSSPIQRKAV
jgi:hypothetical protein